MPHLRKIPLAAAAFAAATALGCGPGALAQSPAEEPEPEDIFAGEPLERLAVEEERAAERAGLRGRLDPEDAEPRDGREESSRRDGSLSAEQTSVLDIEPDDANLKDGSLIPRNLEPRAQPLRILGERQPLGIEEELPREPEEIDPYAPIGVRFGSFLLFPELGAGWVYEDNVFLSTRNPEGDWAYELTPSLLVQSDWSRHSLTANVSAVRSYHERFETEDDKTFIADVTGRLDVRRNTNLVGRAAYSEAFEERSSSDFPTGAALRPKERIRDASLEGNHTFNRVTVTLRGELSEADFSDNPQDTTRTVDESARDFIERRVTARTAYEFQPGIAAFVEASTNERDFTQAVDSDGLRNGSSGYDAQAGLSFRLLGKLTGEASAGYAVQEPDEPTLGNVDGLIFNAALDWRVTGLTTLRLDASSEIDESTDTDTAGSLVRDVELSIEHRPRRNVILGASVGYEHEKFATTGVLEETWRAELSGEYLFTPTLAFVVDWDHERRTSSEPDADFTANEVRMGLRLRR